MKAKKLITCLDFLQIISQALEQNSIEMNWFFYTYKKPQNMFLSSDMVYWADTKTKARRKIKINLY